MPTRKEKGSNPSQVPPTTTTTTTATPPRFSPLRVLPEEQTPEAAHSALFPPEFAPEHAGATAEEAADEEGFVKSLQQMQRNLEAQKAEISEELAEAVSTPEWKAYDKEVEAEIAKLEDKWLRSPKRM